MGIGWIDVIIPTCKAPREVAPQVAEIIATAGVPVRVIPTCTPGSASQNRNIGLDAASSPIRIMLDDDVCDFDEGWAGALVETLRNHPQCVMVSPQLMRPGRSGFGFMMGLAKPDQGKEKGNGCTRITGPHLLTACVAIRKDGLRFDEAFLGSGFEDNEYCDQQNAKYPGCFRLVNHDVQVVHWNEMKQQRENWEHNKGHYERTGGLK